MKAAARDTTIEVADAVLETREARQAREAKAHATKAERECGATATRTVEGVQHVWGPINDKKAGCWTGAMGWIPCDKPAYRRPF